MGCVVLIVLGVLFEVTGLGLVAWQLWRVQRREFGMPAWLVPVRSWWRRLRGLPVTHPVEASLTLPWESNMGATESVRRGPGETVDARLDALEHNVAALDRETSERFGQHQRQLRDLRRSVGVVKAELRRQQQERESEQRGQLRESMTLQWWGTGLFLIGAVLAGVANGVC
jgi:hypothetical protein